MREILFRGRSKVQGSEWLYGDVLIYKNSAQIWETINNRKHNSVVSLETVGQYTGLTDKNGKKIFEGDIMPVWENGEEYHYKVIYNGDCFMLAMLDSEQGSYPLSTKNAISEVIGNIHDNPELLKGGE